MKCPYCLIGIQPRKVLFQIHRDVRASPTVDWKLETNICPECEELFLILFSESWQKQGQMPIREVKDKGIIWPKKIVKTPCPPSVPDLFSRDYEESCLVLDNSPKAAAALSRRCLQNILREKAGVTHGRPVDEINEVINTGKLPSYITSALHQLREFGNYATHPLKNEETGQIVDVELGEAEWGIEVLLLLFDHYFVKPAHLDKIKGDWSKKTGKL